MSSVRQRPNFDRIAHAYRWLEYLTLGSALEHVRFYHLLRLLQRAGQPTRALILGDGDGRFTARWLSADSRVEVHAVDLSNAMLTLLEQRCLASASDAHLRLSLECQDALEHCATSLPQATYDVVVTHFFLDCLQQSEVEHLAADVVPALTPGALWLLSEFRIPSGILHWPARFYVRALYLAFRLLTGLRTTQLPDHSAALGRAGFHVIATHRALLGLLTTELWQRSE